MIENLTHDEQVLNCLPHILPSKRKFFKVATSLANQPVAVSRDVLKQFEAQVKKAADLKLDIKNPNLEFWFLLRTEGLGFAGVRLTYPNWNDELLNQGELRPEIANLMCALSEPSPADIVLDPLAGFGAIPKERSGGFPFSKIIAVENEPELYKKLSHRLKGKNIEIILGDALNLAMIKSGSVDKVITDPPWGIFRKSDIPISELYDKMLTEFARVLKPHGLVIVLMGQPEIFEEVLNSQTAVWKILEKFSILVSGKKANLYKLKLK